MAHSTKVEVTVWATSVSYTFATGMVAERLGVSVLNTPVTHSGDDARIFLGRPGILPKRELNFITSVLAEFDKNHEEFLKRYPEEAGTPLMDFMHNDVHVSITRKD